MADFNLVLYRLATGAAIGSDADVADLAGAGITHVIDCRGDFDDAPLLASHPQISYLWDGTDDDGQSKPTEWFAKGIDFALPVLGRTDSHPVVYAHCAAGVNRGPSMCFAIMLAIGFPAVDAERLIRVARPQVGLAYKTDAITAAHDLGYL